MNTQKAVEYRSRGEAHLYVAIAKADGIVTEPERRSAGYRAKKSQKLFDILGINERVRERIRNDVEHALSNPQFSSWDAQRHLLEAHALLIKAKESGDWGAQLSAVKHEAGLLEVAQIDGYVFKESKLLSDIKKMLTELE